MAAGKGTSLGNAILWLRGDDSPLRKSLAGARSRVGAAMVKMGNAAKAAGKVFTILGAGLAAGVGVATKRYLEFGDQIDKMSKRTGFAAKALSEYKHALELSGSSIEGLETGVRRMQRAITDAGEEQRKQLANIWELRRAYSQAGDSSEKAQNKLAEAVRKAKDASGEYTQTLKMLGLEFKDLRDLSPEAQFELITTRLAEVDDATRRAAIAQEIFGRSGTALLPMLKEGAAGIARMRAEANELGLVIDEKTAGRLATLKDNFQRVTDGISGMRNVLVTALLPTLEVFVEGAIPRIKEGIVWLRDNQDKVRAKIEGVVESIRTGVLPAIRQVWEWLSALVGKYREWRDAHPELAAKIEAFGLALVALSPIIGPLLITIGSLIAAIGGAVGAAGAAGGAMTLVGALAAAGLGIAAVAQALLNLDEQGKNFLNDLVDMIPGAQRAIDGFFDSWLGRLEAVHDWLSKIKYVGPWFFAQSKFGDLLLPEGSAPHGGASGNADPRTRDQLQGAGAGGISIVVNNPVMGGERDVEGMAQMLAERTREELFVRGRR